MAEAAPMAFRERPKFLRVPELEQLMRACPSADALRTGFSLPDADVDELLRAAKQIEGCQVFVDPAYPQGPDLSARIVRLLQLALDVQFRENDQLIADFNTMREEMQDVEERERQAQEELNRLRALRDKEQGTGDIADMRTRNEDLGRRLEDEYRSNDRMRQQRERDERRIEDLEYRVQRSDDDLRARDDQIKELDSQLRRLQDDYTDLRQTYETLRADQAASDAKNQIGDMMRQNEWKIERMMKENRALELQNVELRKQVQDTKTENLEVSEKIVLLDEEVRKLKAHEADLESSVDQLAEDKAALLAGQETLRAEVADKVALLDAFEARFQRQFSSWEEERTALQSQIEALRRGEGVGSPNAAGRRRAAASPGPKDARSGDDADVQDLQEQLNQALEKEVLLLEAYEQLELSVASEIDTALAKQAEELKAAKRRVDFLTQRLDEERAGVTALRDHQAQLEDQVADAVLRNQQYEQGIYGLPQAVEEIHQLKDAVYKEQGRVRDLVDQLSNTCRKLEDLSEQNEVLRQKAGMGPNDKVDTAGVRGQKDTTIAQLRSLNALLERQVADLEEERCKLRMEMKFRAKYHGQHALEMGLTPEQLLLLEQLVEDIKGGRNHEARLVDQLTHRIRFLEVRLGEVMAYADIPPSMRPTLTEFDPVAAITGQSHLFGPAGGAVAHGTAAAGAAPRAGAAAPGNMRAAQLQAVKAALLKSLGMLRQMKTALCEKCHVSDAEYQRWTETLIAQLTDTEQAVDALLKDAAAMGAVPGAYQQAAPAPGVVAMGHAPAGVRAGAPALVPGAPDAGFIADAMADELREHLRGLARQVADLQSAVIQKDATISQLMDQKAGLQAKFGVPLKDRKADFVGRAEFDEVVVEAASLKEQLVACLEEVAAREREAADLTASNARFQGRLQVYGDQVKMLYREYAVALANWQTEKTILERKAKKLQQDTDGFKAANTEYERALSAMRGNNLNELQKELMDTVRRMAVVQIKHAKIARELEACEANEAALAARVEGLEQEVRDVSATCRARMRWLEQVADASKRRVEALFRELQASAPLTAYRQLCEKHARQQGELRRLIEDAAQQVVGAEELLRLRDESAHWMSKYDALADQHAALKERTRQLEMTSQAVQAQAPSGESWSMLGMPQPVTPSLDLALAQELVACRVAVDSGSRRVQLMEAEKLRLQRTLEEAQARLQEVEERLAQAASEGELLRGSRAALEQRLQGAIPKDQADAMVQRLDTAEAAAAEKYADYAQLCHRAQEAESKVSQAMRDRKLHLAEITNLKAALRDVASHRGEQAAIVARLHGQLDHALAKETLARNALNRSEALRFQAEQELRKLQAEHALTVGRSTLHQDHARWMNRQRVEAQAQLDIAMAGRTEAWKAKLWARKLQHLKVRNDVIAETLDLSRKRVRKLEEGQEGTALWSHCKEDVLGLLPKGVSEVVRDAARLHEQVLQLRLARGQLQREEVLLREKAAYVERVNAELHELLEKYELEFFQQQALLEGDKAGALAQARSLQDEVVRLQERLAQLLAGQDNDCSDQARKSLAATTLRVSGDVGARLKVHLAAANAGDRDIMLKQIDSLRAARQEAEHLRQECHKLRGDFDAQGNELADVRRHHNDALARLKQQSEALLYALNHQKGAADQTVLDQMRAVAEATINELKERLKERQKAVEALEAALAAEKAQWLAQHQADRKEIERLTHCLFKYNDDAINRLKDDLQKYPKGGEVDANRGHLHNQLGQTTSELEALRARITEVEAAAELMEKQHAIECARLCAEVDRLTQALEAAKQQQARGPTKQQVDKLEASLRTKDDKLRQLRDAFKALEEKLIAAHKKIIDESSKHASDLATARKAAKDLEDEKRQLATANAQLQAELKRVRQELASFMNTGLAGQVDCMTALQAQLQAECEKVAAVEKQLARCRSELQKYKNAERTVMDLTTGMSVEAKRQIELLQRQVHTLERRNAQLQQRIQASDQVTAGMQPADVDNCDNDDNHNGSSRGDQDKRPGSGRGKQARGEGGSYGEVRGLASGGGARSGCAQSQQDALPGEVGSGSAAAARSAAAVAQWEESKRLNRKVEELRKKLACKQEEVVVARTECERRAGQLAAAQKEVDQQAAAIRDLQEKLVQAQRQQAQAPAHLSAADIPKLKTYADKLAAVEAELDSVRAQLARSLAVTSGNSRTQADGTPSAQQASQSGTSSKGAGQPDPLMRDADVFELKLQRDQAQAQVKRLQERLADLFGEAAASASGARAVAGAGRRGTAGGAGAAARSSTASAREAELLCTVTTLKAALEKATIGTTPTTKYMAEVQRRKDAQAEASTAQQEVAKLRSQGATLQRMVADLQAQTADLRRQLRAAQDGSSNAAAAAAPGAAASAQVTALEAALDQRDMELQALKAALARKEEQLAAAGSSDMRGASPGGPSHDQMAQLQAAVRDLQEENNDLKAELNAFDPQFFDEIEDLKYEHEQLSVKVEEYEGMIVQLSARMGVPTPAGIPFKFDRVR